MEMSGEGNRAAFKKLQYEKCGKRIDKRNEKNERMFYIYRLLKELIL